MKLKKKNGQLGKDAFPVGWFTASTRYEGGLSTVPVSPSCRASCLAAAAAGGRLQTATEGSV